MDASPYIYFLRNFSGDLPVAVPRGTLLSVSPCIASSTWLPQLKGVQCRESHTSPESGPGALVRRPLGACPAVPVPGRRPRPMRPVGALGPMGRGPPGCARRALSRHRHGPASGRLDRGGASCATGGVARPGPGPTAVPGLVPAQRCLGLRRLRGPLRRRPQRRGVEDRLPAGPRGDVPAPHALAATTARQQRRRLRGARLRPGPVGSGHHGGPRLLESQVARSGYLIDARPRTQPRGGGA